MIYSLNQTNPGKLKSLAKSLYVMVSMGKKETAFNAPDLERDIRLQVNSLMDGDGGINFLANHRAALDFISQLLNRLAMEIEEKRAAAVRATLKGIIEDKESLDETVLEIIHLMREQDQ